MSPEPALRVVASSPTSTNCTPVDPKLLATLRALERKVLWLAAWTIHNANNLRPKRDGLKVGGHQASSASLATLMTALYFHTLRPEDRVAVKPHASPVFHAIQYLLGRQTREKLERFRGLGGAQSYPSRTKDIDDVDLSTGSVGLGVAATLFASMVQDYVQLKGMVGTDVKPGRMVALVGDAEFDEGNIFEAMLEGWKHDVRNLWWIIDYNRQSLDSVVSDRLFQRIIGVFSSLGWRVITLKYGKLLQAAFAGPDGRKLEEWIDECPNSLYSALTYKRTWRAHLEKDLGHLPGIRALLAGHDDAALHRLMTNLAGHDMEAVLEAFRDGETSDLPTCFIAYTIKGNGLAFAGHKDNHAGLMNDEQMAQLRDAHSIAPGEEWEPFAGLEIPAAELSDFLARTPFSAVFPRRHHTQRVPVPATLETPRAATMSTQEGFGRILYEIAGSETPLSRHVVTTSPDVTVSTNLGGWVNRRGLFDRRDQRDIFKEEKIVSAQLWQMGHGGQHIELGIAEHNLFLMLGALGLSSDLFGARLLPVGTVYDPFIARGLDALNYGCYQDSRFMIVATPSGLSLAPEGGAHQSVAQPLIGMGQPGLVYFEPAHVDELAEIMRWSFEHMQADAGSSVYLRLSTRPIAQPERVLGAGHKADIVAGGYWIAPPTADTDLVLVAMGALVPEAEAALATLREDVPGAGLLVVTSPDRLHADWRDRGAQSHIANLLGRIGAPVRLVTVLDGHPATLSWLGSVRGDLVEALGVERFGQSGDLVDLYRLYGLDSEAIVGAAARVLLR
ncbi:MAG: transketolase [Alphaproteobacteria bacterium]|nr:transketolase [Alphaproteobacteria bacterium]